MRPRILFAITGHGYGHATRSLSIAAEVRRRHPEVEVTCSTAVPRTFLRHSGAGDLALRQADYEPGTIERTCFEVDMEATRGAYRRFAAERESRIAAEAAFLHEGGYSGVVSDIAALPIAAAARVGIPAAAVSNFTWDWILEPLLSGDPDLSGLPAVLAADYRGAETYLRLPFHPPEHPFRRVQDLPLVGRRSFLPRESVRERLGVKEGSGPVVLVTIGGFGAEGWPEIVVPGPAGLEFLVVGDLPVRFSGPRARAIPSGGVEGLGFEDLVAAADLVLAKPGYGISSECAANGTPLLGVERRGFREYSTLKEGLARVIPFREIPLEDFLAGRWLPAIEGLAAAPRAAPAPSTGARAAAESLAALFGWD